MHGRTSGVPTFLGIAALLLCLPLFASHTPNPGAVTVAGSLQSELGCSDDWQPACSATHLTFDAEDDVWHQTFNVPAGNWEYKAPLNDSWTENYGANAAPNGGNIPLNLADPTAVKFYYDHKTHWITSNRNTVIATAPGSFQSELGCGGDWDPSCLRSWLQDPDGDGTYTFTTASLPAGNYEVKVAINESWSENYGAGGAPGGANIPFTVTSDCAATTFSYDATTHVLTVAPGAAPLSQPTSVTIAGSLQSELGCSGDWQPDCAATHLTFDAADTVWQGTFNLPAGSWEYKAPLNDSWDENYGANATRNGSNIALNLSEAKAVKFYYDHGTHWVTDNHNKVIATLAGSFQSELGCPGDWQPDCLRSWLQDPDGDGIYTFSTSALPAGNYETKVAINENWDVNYGAGGAQNGANIAFSVPAACTPMFFSYDAATHILSVTASGAPKGNIQKAQAYWVTEETIAWNVPASVAEAKLHFSATGDLALEATGVTGGTDIELTPNLAGLDAAILAKFPHLATFKAFTIGAGDLDQVAEALKGQLAVSAFDGGGDLVDATSLQIQGVLDDLYTHNGPLGATFAGNVPTLRVWAPTARSVDLLLFADDTTTSPTSHSMTLDPATGVWSVTGEASWYGRYYLYEVEVFVRATGEVETNLVTDPYSVNLSRNSARTQILDLNDPATKPAGWSSLVKPQLDAPEDIVLYELHIRDFSANDLTVPAADRGTYKAFTHLGANGMEHLASLAEAGLTHVHLLPSFDIATINEDKSQWQEPAGDLSTFPPDSDQQQAAVSAVRDVDAFNWGYDPWHFNVPEGSYATSTAGAQRVLEYRQMVQGLASAGLRVVNDVVYNHTNSAGQNDKSVLDKIVPGYYHRLNADGNVETSTCCQNTASEFNMMEKLLIDSALLWAKQYKVDGFRFDLMGHHSKANILKLRQALDALTLAGDGVDGTKIYIYGEGWNFGEVANNARFVQATQANMAGTGIGTFSDRLRDGVRGGGPFSGIQEQGFLTGLYYDPNATNQGSPADQLNTLRLRTDWIQVGLAGNLADYQFIDRNGNPITGEQLDYNGQPAGYTADPQENISYIEAHDNETLFDAIQFKAPVGTSMAQRVRMQNLGLSILGFGQGVPFIHAGAELLRSKSLDRNSYNSGDWFNKLDFTYASNNFGVGLPMASDNQANWPIMQPLLANPALKPAGTDIIDAYDHLLEVLKIRRSSALFRLRTAADIQSGMQFHNTGPSALPGLIAMTIADGTGAIDRQHRLAAVLFNANDEAQTFDSSLDGKALSLHPVFAASADPIVRTATFTSANGTFWIPGRTAAVFWEIRPAADQIGLLAGDVNALVTAGSLTKGEGKSLLAKLNAAIEQASRGNNTAAATQLNAFINEVQALLTSRRLPAVQAEALIAEARTILASL